MVYSSLGDFLGKFFCNCFAALGGLIGFFIARSRHAGKKGRFFGVFLGALAGVVVYFVVVLVVGAMTLMSSAPVVATQRPNPTATYRPYPTSTFPRPTQETCLAWDAVNTSHIGKTICVTGYVYDLYPIGVYGFRIRFTNQPNAFFLLDQQGYYPDLRSGDCVVAEDAVRQENGLLYMSIEALRHCP